MINLPRIKAVRKQKSVAGRDAKKSATDHTDGRRFSLPNGFAKALFLRTCHQLWLAVFHFNFVFDRLALVLGADFVGLPVDEALEGFKRRRRSSTSLLGERFE